MFKLLQYWTILPDQAIYQAQSKWFFGKIVRKAFHHLTFDPPSMLVQPVLNQPQSLF